MMWKVLVRLLVCILALCLMWVWGYWAGKSRMS